MRDIIKTFCLVLLSGCLLWEGAIGHPQDSCGCEPTVWGRGYTASPQLQLEPSAESYQKLLSELGGHETESDYLYELAYLALKTSNLDDAIKYFKRSVELNNFTKTFYDDFVYYWLALSWERKGNLEEALKYYLKHDDIYFICLIQAKIYEQSGKIHEANQELRKASKMKLRRDAYNTEPWKLLAEFELRRGMLLFARYYATKYVNELELENIDVGHEVLVPESVIEDGRQLLLEIEKKIME